MVGLVEVVLLWVVVAVVVPVRFLSFPTMSLKKTMRTMMVVAQWEVVLRLVLHVSEDVVLRARWQTWLHLSSSVWRIVSSFRERWWFVNLHMGGSALFGFRWDGTKIDVFCRRIFLV